MRKDLEEIIKSAYKDGDATAAYHAALAMNNLMLTRLYVQRYLVSTDKADYDRVKKELQEYDAAEKLLVAELQNPDRLRLAKSVDAQLAEFAAEFEKVYEAITRMNERTRDVLDNVGPEVAKLARELKADNLKVQHTLGSQIVSELEFLEIFATAMSVLAVGLGILAAVVLTRAINRPITAMTGAMKALADGDLSAVIPATENKDEIGEMAQAVDVFKRNAIEVDRLKKAQEEADRKAEEARKSLLAGIADQIQSSIGAIAEKMATAAIQVRGAAGSLSTQAAQTSQESAAVASAAAQASQNVETVAAAAEELSASVGEIGQQVARSTQVSDRAVSEIKETTDNVGGLSEAATRIGEVVNLISDIAEQTNLLALNATIEAARAGEAGKGFAVVASEVKNLANQTARATDDISAQVAGIQAATKSAVQSIHSIGEIIHEINEVTNAIAAATEEQTAATREIARNVEEASSGTQQVTQGISSVAGAAEETGANAKELLATADGVGTDAAALKEQVMGLVQKIRTA